MLKFVIEDRAAAGKGGAGLKLEMEEEVNKLC